MRPAEPLRVQSRDNALFKDLRRLAQEALARGAALLPNVSVTPTASVIATPTAC